MTRRRHLWDERIGGIPRLIYGYESELMQVPPELLKCVCFIEVRVGSEWYLNGTAFFVSRRLVGVHPSLGSEFYAVYAVTAQHVLMVPGLDQTSREAPWWCDDARLVLNRTDGVRHYIPTPIDGWEKHLLSDTAVFPLDSDVLYGFDYMHYPSESYVDPEFFTEVQVSPGDEVLLPGLLSVHPGGAAIQPIVRTGNIAMFPADGSPLSLDTGEEPGILIEVRSFGGLSGSPAFLHLGDTRREEWGRGVAILDENPAGPAGKNFLLGIVNGWFPNYEPASVDGRHGLNTGITAVIPAARMSELLNREVLIKQREDLVKEKNKNAPSAKSASVVQKQQGNEEWERFNTLASQVANTTKPEKDEASE